MIGNDWNGIGRITDELELKKSTSGKDTLSFTLACDKRNQKQLEQEGKPTANFIRCVAWEYNARLLSQYCKKGSQIAVNGSVETRTYQDRNGKNVFVTEILIDNIKFLDSKPVENNNSFQTVDDVVAQRIDDSNLPF